MVKVGLLSDTHGWLDPKIVEFFKDCNEVWHCGDIGDVAITAYPTSRQSPIRINSTSVAAACGRKLLKSSSTHCVIVEKSNIY